MKRKNRFTGRSAAYLSAPGIAMLSAFACGQSADLDTRTFELQYLNPAEAVEMVMPYVYGDRPGSPGVVTHFSSGLTVRETADNLAKIQRVLEEYDIAKPGVRLHFQLITANGADVPDPAILEIERVLRDLFRFEGYSLAAEAQIGAMEGTGSTQAFYYDQNRYGINAYVQQIRQRGGTGAVQLHVELVADYAGSIIETAMTIPVGQTVVLGSAQPDPDRPAIILAVRPELVTLPGDEGN